jgi:hypothetical protein
MLLSYYSPADNLFRPYNTRWSFYINAGKVKQKSYFRADITLLKK